MDRDIIPPPLPNSTPLRSIHSSCFRKSIPAANKHFFLTTQLPTLSPFPLFPVPSLLLPPSSLPSSPPPTNPQPPTPNPTSFLSFLSSLLFSSLLTPLNKSSLTARSRKTQPHLLITTCLLFIPSLPIYRFPFLSFPSAGTKWLEQRRDPAVWRIACVDR